eukprot:1136239-Pelagomonas_calceolata.AAC.4
MARLVEGMGSIDSPIHTQEACVESNLCTLELFAQLLCCCCEASSWAPGLSTRCEGEVGGIFELAGQGVTKIEPGRLEVHLAWPGACIISCDQPSVSIPT